MSQEFLIRVFGEKSADAVEDAILALSKKNPLFVVSEDGRSMWIPSTNPMWVDFSIEVAEGGLFVVSNLNGKENSEIVSIVEGFLDSCGVTYDIEDV